MRLTQVKDFDCRILAGAGDTEYAGLVYDTRKVVPGCLFVCQKGLNYDSHQALAEIAAGGAAGIVVQEDCIGGLSLPEGCDVIAVPETRHALALLAACFFGYPAEAMTLAAVTGTKGKTTTACMVKKLLESAGYKTGYMGTIGIDYPGFHQDLLNTTPESYIIQESLAKMRDAGCTHAVMEVSSQAAKMRRIDGMRFDWGIFTNISNDHIGPAEHADFEEYLSCKAAVLAACDRILVNLDDEHAAEAVSLSGCKEVLGFGEHESADYRIGEIRYVSRKDFIGLELDLHAPGKDLKVDVSIPGGFNAWNAAAAAALCDRLGVPDEVLEGGLRDIHVSGRMETVFSNADMKVIVDYAHNAVSTESLLKTLRNYHPKRLVVVFGCGGNRSKERRYDMGRIAGELSDLAIITEDNSRFEDIHDIIADIRSAFDKTGGHCVEIPKREEAVYYALAHHEPGDIIAIIGKGHEDYIEVRGVRTHYTDREAVLSAAEKLKEQGRL